MTIPKIGILCLILIFHFFNSIFAQIITDGSLGTKQQFDALNTIISAEFGQRRGNNLFHSFETFNLRQGESVTFTGADTVTSIISRVTGGNASVINGLLKSTIPNASFYLINPYGITLGEQAQLDINGAFHARVADGISLADGGYFAALNPNASILSTAPPFAFGFLDLSSQPTEIKLYTNILASTFYAPGGRISVNKIGNLAIHDSILFAPNGQIDIQTDGLFDLSLNTLALLPDLDQNGNIDIGSLDVKGGYLRIQAQDFTASKALMLADNFTLAQGTGIDMQINNTLTLAEGASVVSRNFNADGQGGDINIYAAELVLTGINPEIFNADNPASSYSTITTNSEVGTGGNIGITTNSLLVNQALIQSAVNQGLGGNIDIHTQNLYLQNTSFINSDSFGAGQAGDISITAQNIMMYREGFIGNAVKKGATGDAGNITIKTKNLSLDAGSEINNFNEGSGQAGNVRINSDNVTIDNNSNIVTDADFNQAGNVEIDATDTLTVDNLSNITAISASPESNDQGGNIIIRSGNFYLNDSDLLANANAGMGGQINLQANELTVAGDSSMDVTSQLNLNGDIFINNINADTVVNVLPNIVYEPNPPVRCHAKKRADLNSFVVTNYNVLPESPYEYYFLSDATLSKSALLKKLQENLPAKQRATYLNDLANILSIELRQNRYFDYALAAEEMFEKLQPALQEKHNPSMFRKMDLKQLHRNIARLLYQTAFNQTDSQQNKVTVFLNQIRFQSENGSLPFDSHFIAKEYIDKLSDTSNKAQFLLSLYQIKSELAYLHEALQLAGKAKKPYLQSWAYGLLAEAEENPAVNFRKAIFYANNSRSAPELLYRWYWNIGQLQQSVTDYQKALAEIQKLRPVLINSYLATNSYFTDYVKPVYFDFITQLFENPQQNIGQILKVLAAFKAVELQNYMQDDCIEEVTATSQLKSIPPKTAIFYPIPLRNGKVGLVLQLSGKKLQWKITDSLGRQTTYKEAIKTREVLYEKLIKPIKPLLQQHAIETLVIAPTSTLRAIPFAALYDNQTQQYLIEQYALALLYQMPAKPLQKAFLSNKKILLAGLSTGVKLTPSGITYTHQKESEDMRSIKRDKITGEITFSPLPKVLSELNAIQKIYPDNTFLLDANFTYNQIEREIISTAYPIVHFATHASLENHAENAYLLAYDQKISFDALQNLLTVNLSRDEPIELLALSACQTAKSATAGDSERAALGLAGVGIKTGAQSVLATLQTIKDSVAEEVVKEFYKQLQNPSITKAKALQAAQLKMVKKQKDKSLHWAAFVLVGNWL